MRPMSTSKPIHIFKPGTHTAMNGMVLNFTENDLSASAQAYDPAVHEAPLVVGHPVHDAPAYGWVRSLRFAENGLHADPSQVDPAFAELVGAGRFKKISASFYPPNAPSNPKPGVYYLRHVGFLGAQPPAIKGLKQVAFADSTDCITLEFSEYDDVTNAGLWRGMREWFIGKFGQDEADKVVPQYAVQLLEQSAQDELKEESMDSKDGILPNPAYTEPGDTIMSVEDKARLAELEAENKRLKTAQAEFAEQTAAAKAAADHAGHLAFAEGLVKAGKLLPAQKDLAIALLDFMAADDGAVEFGEGETKKPLLDAIKNDLLDTLPKQVEFREIGTGADDETQSLNFAAPDNLPVNSAAMQVHNAAESYAAKHNVDYLTAVKAVQNR
jgi:hypothetical protein